MATEIKSKDQIYNEVMDMIRNEKSINKLKDILIETLDNSPINYDCINDVYVNYIQDIE